MGLFTLAWNSVLEIFKLVALPVSKLRGNRRWGQVLRWSLHAAAVVTITVCLAWLNHILDLEQVIRTPWHAARQLWLPLMFLLVYTLAWLGWWLFRIASVPRAASLHPDLDDAWREACQSLEQAGIDLSATPLYLLLGRPAAAESSLINAARIPLAVPQTPRRRDAPLHAYANDEAVYLTCAGSSLLGRHAELLLQEQLDRAAQKSAAKDAVPAPSAAEGDDLGWDNPSFEPPAEWTPSQGESLEKLEQGVALLVEDRQPQTAATTFASPQQEAPPHASVLDRGDEVDLYAARLAHLCRLIVQQRRPYCPINGVVVLAPLAGTDTDADASQLAAVVERDLNVLEQSLRVSCPVVLLVCDLEQAEGCREFLERMPEEQRRRRLGVTFPYVAAADMQQLPAMLAEGIRWLCQELAPSLVYRLIPPPRPDLEEADPELDGNIRRYRFLCQLRQRQSRLVRLLTRGLNPGSSPWQLRGCYMAATGCDATREQAFVAGVFPALSQLQNALSWTPAALREDRQLRCWALAGYASLLAFVAICATALLWG